METIDNIKEVLKSIEELPTLPAVITHILELIRNPRTSASDIGKALSADIALSSKILKIVNSAFYGFPQKISTVTQAVVILGFNTIKSAVLGVSVIDAFDKVNKENLRYFDIGKFWEHSISTAAIARAIAKKTGFKSIEEVFIAGILHDVGKLIMELFWANAFEDVLNIARDNRLLTFDAELEVLGYTHCDIGGALIQLWNFPDELLQPVLYHHYPQNAKIKTVDEEKIVSIIHFANILSTSIGMNDGISDFVPPLNNKSWTSLNLNTSQLRDLLKLVNDEILRSDEFFNI